MNDCGSTLGALAVGPGLVYGSCRPDQASWQQRRCGGAFQFPSQPPSETGGRGHRIQRCEFTSVAVQSLYGSVVDRWVRHGGRLINALPVSDGRGPGGSQGPCFPFLGPRLSGAPDGARPRSIQGIGIDYELLLGRQFASPFTVLAHPGRLGVNHGLLSRRVARLQELGYAAAGAEGRDLKWSLGSVLLHARPLRRDGNRPGLPHPQARSPSPGPRPRVRVHRDRQWVVWHFTGILELRPQPDVAHRNLPTDHGPTSQPRIRPTRP